MGQWGEKSGRQALFFLTIAGVAVFATLVLYRGAFPLLQQLDLRLKDARFQLRVAEQPAAPVTIVAIDNRSVKELGRWPWSRELTARLVSAIARQGARVTAVDMVFAEPQGEAPDIALAKAVSGAGNVTLGYFFRDESQPVTPQALEQLAASRVQFLVLAPGVVAMPVRAYWHVDANLPLVGKGAAAFGFFNQLEDDDGLYRSIPLLMLFKGDLYPSLALAAVARYLGEPVQVRAEVFGISALRLGRLSIPVNEQGRQSLAYYGPAGTVHTVSAVDVLSGRLPPRMLKDRLVFVGVTETGVADLRATPVDGIFPGVELHATLAANALEGKFLTRDGRTIAVEIGVIILLPLLLALLLAAVPGTLWGLGAFFLTAAGYLGMNLRLFSGQRLDLSLAYPLLPLLLTYLGGEAYRNLVVERRGRYLRKAFATYLSHDLVNEIVKHPDRLKLGGEKREITVFFSDIRGFTGISERLSPEKLVALLNSYLSPMTRLVMAERGTLDKYIGDAIMAIFNAPLDVPDHPARACRCALLMQVELARLNDELLAQGLPAIAIGVGIHTGEAVVGNMGADVRFDYTAIGDTVNLASRLEGLNKVYGTSILVSGVTCERAGPGFQFRELDLVRVKGKEQPVALFEMSQEPFPATAEFDGALADYRKGCFARACATFSRLATDYNDPVSGLYVERCREYEAEPPPEGWDGVFVARGK